MDNETFVKGKIIQAYAHVVELSGGGMEAKFQFVLDSYPDFLFSISCPYRIDVGEDVAVNKMTAQGLEHYKRGSVWVEGHYGENHRWIKAHREEQEHKKPYLVKWDGLTVLREEKIVFSFNVSDGPLPVHYPGWESQHE